MEAVATDVRICVLSGICVYISHWVSADLPAWVPCTFVNMLWLCACKYFLWALPWSLQSPMSLCLVWYLEAPPWWCHSHLVCCVGGASMFAMCTHDLPVCGDQRRSQVFFFQVIWLQFQWFLLYWLWHVRPWNVFKVPSTFLQIYTLLEVEIPHFSGNTLLPCGCLLNPFILPQKLILQCLPGQLPCTPFVSADEFSLCPDSQ